MCEPSATEVAVLFNSDDQEAYIHPGDYIVADLNGVVRVPGHLVQRVLGAVKGIVAADEQCAEAILNGMPLQEAFKKYRGK